MTKLTSFFLALLILASCTNQDTAKERAQNDDTINTGIDTQAVSFPPIDTTFKPDFFDAIPDTIDGCGEYFTYDTIQEAKDKYIFLSNLTGFAIIKVRGNFIFLDKDTAESKEINSKSYIAVYRGQGYKAVLKVKQVKAYDEGGFYSGTLEIISDKKKITYKVHGQAGC